MTINQLAERMQTFLAVAYNQDPDTLRYTCSSLASLVLEDITKEYQLVEHSRYNKLVQCETIIDQLKEVVKND